MLDRQFIRDNPDAVRNAARAKGVALDLEALLGLDDETRKLQTEIDDGLGQKNALSQQFAKADPDRREQLRAKSTAIDEQVKRLRETLDAATRRLTDLLLVVPNIPWDEAPVGLDESANVTIRTWGERPIFDFAPLDHVDLAKKRGWIELGRARKVAGERAYALTGDLLLLERALHSYALQLLTMRGFTLIAVPALVKEAPLIGSGMFPKGHEETYALPADSLYLAGTAEVALVGLHSGEILDRDRLPVLYAGISPCFRREIGSAGRDVHGLLRVHQFEKVEQFVLCEADSTESARWHAELLRSAERILQDLGLHYEVVECATGDMGLGKFRMNDINTWFPSLHTLRETHSCSTFHDWQARRANVRYRGADGKVRFVHTLNNTAVATPRLLAALIENHQTKEGEVRIPPVLRPFLGGREGL